MELAAQTSVNRPAVDVWALLADYGNDPRWRTGVVAMDSRPRGIAKPGTLTEERIRFAARTWCNDGEVVAVEAGSRLVWRTTSGIDAQGSRTVTPAGAGRCVVRLETRLRPRGVERVIVLLLGWLLRRNMARDLARLRRLAEAG